MKEERERGGDRFSNGIVRMDRDGEMAAAATVRVRERERERERERVSERACVCVTRGVRKSEGGRAGGDTAQRARSRIHAGH
jgi:hypothetical protein